MPRVAKTIWAVTVLYWGVMFYLTHAPLPDLGQRPLSDKLEHFLAYGLLGGLLYLSLWLTSPRRTDLPIIILAVGMVYGAIDELTQLVPGINRHASFLDWCANVAGLATAVVGMTVIRWMVARFRARVAVESPLQETGARSLSAET